MTESFITENDLKKVISCPAGQKPIESVYTKSKKQYYARFSAAICLECTLKSRCPNVIKSKFSIVRFREHEVTLSREMNNEVNKASFITSRDRQSGHHVISFDDYKKSSDQICIPGTIGGIEVTEIPEQAFAGSLVRKVTLPDTVKTIGHSAFSDCKNLIEITIPDSVTVIDAHAFSGCSSLENIILSDNVTEIGSYAFDECRNLQSVKLPKKIHCIGAYAFSETAIKEIKIPQGIKYLGNSLFYNCHFLNEVILSDGIEVIGLYAFGNCDGLTKIILPDSIRTISNSAFQGCENLAYVRLPKNLSELHPTSFSGCINLEVVEIDNIDKKVEVFNPQKKMLEELGLKSTCKIEYDTIFNLLSPVTNKVFTVEQMMPVKKTKRVKS